jgi:hypothetical protein
MMGDSARSAGRTRLLKAKAGDAQATMNAQVSRAIPVFPSMRGLTDDVAAAAGAAAVAFVIAVVAVAFVSVMGCFFDSLNVEFIIYKHLSS